MDSEEDLLINSMTKDEIHAALRFCNLCDDNEGYDIPRKMMHRLSELGLTKYKGRGVFEQTELLLDVRQMMQRRA